MKKYTIDDLIIDDPVSGSEKSGQKPRGKFTTIIALIAIIVVAGVFLSKMKMGSFTDSNTTEETKIEDGDIKELLEPKQEKSVNAEQEAQKAADDLSIAITELDSLALPTTELKKEELVATKVEDLVEQKVGALVPAAQEMNKTADEPSVAAVETENPESTIAEPKIDETAAVGTEKLPETKQEKVESTDQEPEKISDILPAAGAAGIAAETLKPNPETDTKSSIRNEGSTVESTTQPTKEAETDTLKNSTPEVVDSQDKPKTKEEKTEQPKQETESAVAKTPDTKTEDAAAKKEKEKITTEKKKVKSEPKPKQDGFFNMFSKKSNYYILVGSNPSSKFLSKIKNANLRYVIRKSNGKRRVFIGPYSSSSSAKHSIGKVQKATGIKGVVVKAK